MKEKCRKTKEVEKEKGAEQHKLLEKENTPAPEKEKRETLQEMRTLESTDAEFSSSALVEKRTISSIEHEKEFPNTSLGIEHEKNGGGVPSGLSFPN